MDIKIKVQNKTGEITELMATETNPFPEVVEGEIIDWECAESGTVTFFLNKMNDLDTARELAELSYDQLLDRYYETTGEDYFKDMDSLEAEFGRMPEDKMSEEFDVNYHFYRFEKDGKLHSYTKHEVYNIEAEYISQVMMDDWYLPYMAYKIAADYSPVIRQRGDLEPRMRDDDDFLDIYVWALKSMLADAYVAGLKDGEDFL